MEEIKVMARKWGNSVGFVLPRKVVEDRKIKDGSEIVITIEPVRSMTVGDLMKLSGERGMGRAGKSSQVVFDKIDEELWDE